MVEESEQCTNRRSFFVDENLRLNLLWNVFPLFTLGVLVAIVTCTPPLVWILFLGTHAIFIFSSSWALRFCNFFRVMPAALIFRIVLDDTSLGRVCTCMSVGVASDFPIAWCLCFWSMINSLVAIIHFGNDPCSPTRLAVELGEFRVVWPFLSWCRIACWFLSGFWIARFNPSCFWATRFVVYCSFCSPLVGSATEAGASALFWEFCLGTHTIFLFYDSPAPSRLGLGTSNSKTSSLRPSLFTW